LIIWGREGRFFDQPVVFGGYTMIAMAADTEKKTAVNGR
jgi:hypothetical protein